MDWTEELYRMAKTDETWLSWQAELQKRQHHYDQILGALTLKQQEVLRDYISVCQEAEYALVSIAYDLGHRNQEKPGNG